MDKLNANEIKNILKEQYNYSDEMIRDMKGIKQLRNELKMARELDTDFENMEMNMETENSIGQDAENSIDQIKYLHTGWTDYILGQLEENEKDQNYPKAAGLRRLVETHIGPILHSITTNVSSLDGSIIVQQEIEVDNRVSQQVEVWSRNGESNSNNTPFPFSKYSVATAESRAEARCLRAILRLNVATAEEMIGELEVKNRFDLIEESLTENQVSVINNLSGNSNRGVNINVNELIKVLFDKIPKKLSRENGAAIIEKLNEYQKNPESIDESLRGFKENWRG